jgi:DNA-binding SARP family transcriptional activator/tetratricopeptide (TPR) repeat protein/transcriptional regulator with XRE-family HTH domain
VDQCGEFGVLLGSWRRAAGLTQQQLAGLAGVSTAAVRDLEQGRRRRPRPATVARLSAALKLDVRQGLALELAARQLDAPAGTSRRTGPGTIPAAGLWVQVLGPSAAWRGGEPVALGPAPQRAVLGLLALSPPDPVHRETIIDVLWPGDPPATAVNMVQAYVGRLRRALDPGRTPRDGHGLLVSAGTSYLLRVTAHELDWLMFGQLARQARELCSAGDAVTGCDLYEQSLQLWRGEALCDAGPLRCHPRVTALTERQTAVIIEYAQAASAAGQHSRVLPHLRALVGREPLNETAHAQLMTALAGSGQQGAALHVYHEVRRRLDEQLGVYPGAELSRVLNQVLQHDSRGAPAPGASAPRPGTPGPHGRATIAPRQLPPAAWHFAGRQDELRGLAGWLREAGGTGGTVMISAIGGMAGVGKTALAVYWAHQVAGQFPDGQLYVDLRGFGPSGDPVAPDRAVRGFLDALGIPAERIPATLGAQTGLYRSLLAGKRMLLVLDNARDEDQVRPLLPASPGCLAVVTSRTKLTGLATAEGARMVTLDVLTDAEARELLARRLGPEPASHEPRAADELIGQCARLPLALSIAATRAAEGFPLGALAAELRDEHTRLDALGAGDPATSVRAVFSWSYQHLRPPAARMFRLLGLPPGIDITAHAAASLAGVPVEQARELLRELARAHLLTEHAPGRYSFHDLLRSYATRQCQALDSEPDRRAALTRLFDHYLAAAGAAMDTLRPAERDRRPSIPVQARPLLPALDTANAAHAWLDAERGTLVAVAEHTATHGWPSHTTRLAAVLSRYYLEIGGHYADGLTVQTHALHAARQSGDRAAQASALRFRSTVDNRQSRYQQAAGQLERALAIYRDLGDRRGQALVLNNLGVVMWSQARYQPSAEHHQQAAALFAALGDQFGQAMALNNLGVAFCWQGRYQQAIDQHQRSLAIRRELGDRRGAANALGNVGNVLSRQGRYTEAASHHEQALAVFRELDDRDGEADSLNALGVILRGQGHYEPAIVHHQQALAMFRELGNRRAETEALNGIGEALNALGETGQARARHHEALTLASEIGNRHMQARSHDGLARTYHATGDLAQARRQWERALDLYASLGVPEADQVRAKLDSTKAVSL